LELVNKFIDDIPKPLLRQLERNRAVRVYQGTQCHVLERKGQRLTD